MRNDAGFAESCVSRGSIRPGSEFPRPEITPVFFYRHITSEQAAGDRSPPCLDGEAML
jgi:hypothetical protein